ncbi:MAG: outer membrane protein assembly factor BamB [Zoogloeaceae bacterium]|jgi:outer membrane protein assembly factor BamB|nr:outer membrane protein assembly factor BamB [Zoogloeaceae bacterium]
MMRKHQVFRPLRRSLPFLVAFLVSGCSMLPSLDRLNPFASSAPKMAELPAITPLLKVRAIWSYSIGKAGEAVFYPAVAGEAVFVAAADGALARLEDGNARWRVQTEKKPLTAGVGSNGDLVVVAAGATVLVYSAADGSPRWQAKVSSEVLAPPLVTEDLVLVKSGDNRIVAFDHAGRQKWLYQRPTPSLILRAAAPLAAIDPFVLSGFPNGKLVALALTNGAPVWEGTVAVPTGSSELERMADVASAPVVLGAIGCAVAWQGRVSCFDFSENGRVLWSRDISSAAGLGLDQRAVYVTDERSVLHALAPESGSSLWRQEKLLRRNLTAPLPLEAHLAVGDAKGIVHFLSRGDGEFTGRFETDGSPILSAPQSLRQYVLVQTRAGHVYALDAQ